MEILPEFARSISLVVRDFYHRTRLTEHSLRTIEHLQTDRSADNAAFRWAPLLEERSTARLLIFALLLHDTARNAGGDHVTGIGSAETAAQRLGLSRKRKRGSLFDRASSGHVGAVQRRDIFDPSIVSGFAESVGTLERL